MPFHKVLIVLWSVRCATIELIVADEAGKYNNAQSGASYCKSMKNDAVAAIAAGPILLCCSFSSIAFSTISSPKIIPIRRWVTLRAIFVDIGTIIMLLMNADMT